MNDNYRESVVCLDYWNACHIIILEYSNHHDYCNLIPESNSGHDINNHIKIFPNFLAGDDSEVERWSVRQNTEVWDEM